MNKNELKLALKEITADDDISDVNFERWFISAFMRLGKAKPWSWNRGYSATLSLITGTQTYALPTGFLSMRHLRIADGTGTGTTDEFVQCDFNDRSRLLYTWKRYYISPADATKIVITKAITASENGRNIQYDYSKLIDPPTDDTTDMGYIYISQDVDFYDKAMVHDMAKSYWIGEDDSNKVIYHDTEFLNAVDDAWRGDRNRIPNNFIPGVRNIAQ